MAELKHQFTGGRMNKDLDERLVPNGEYRDALNVNVNVSEGDDVGTVQTTLGNILHGIKCTPYGLPGVTVFTNQAKCIGSIADDKNDKLYWFITDIGAGIDAIAEYDIRTSTIRPVMVDTYYNTGGRRALNFNNINYITGINIIEDMLFWTDNHSEPKKINIPRSIQGSTDFCTCTKFLTKQYHPPLGGELINNGNFLGGSTSWFTPGWSTCNPGVDDFIITNGILQGLEGCAVYAHNTFTTPLTSGAYYKLTYTIVEESSTGGGIHLRSHDTSWSGNPFYNLELQSTVGTHYIIFHQNQSSPHWTETSLGLWLTKEWTGIIDQISLVEVDPQPDPVHPVTGEPLLTALQNSPCIEEKHITVIKENPVLAPVLEMSQTPSRSSEDISGIIAPISLAVSQAWKPGATAANQQWWTENNGIMGWHWTFGGAYPPGYSRRFVVTGNPSWKVGDILILTSNTDPAREKQVKIEITAVDGEVTGHPSYQEYLFKIISIEADVDAGDLSWSATLEPAITSLFEFKFPRFATRYKYQDGEYSAFSPFTEIAFLPGRPMDEDFKYEPKQGFNLGMTNNVRYLALKQFVPKNSLLPDGVIAIDILYKESDSPNVYTVKTITPGDVEWQTQIDGGSVLSGTRGYVRIKSEMIHAILPSNQLLRPWDNVPRKALAQEVSGNRIIYGNYLQNYTVPSVELEIGLHSRCLNADSGCEDVGWNIPEEIYPENAHTYLPAKSIKTLRTYQLGIVFRDKYGRETPVITDDTRISLSGKASIYVEKEWADWQNKFTAQLHTQPPSWATTYKWFIKETSSEYYNLALDRWYDAQDWNVWLSFPSSERNKVDIETFLILKKEEDVNTFVHDDGRYKILAIENEAPDYIKERHVTVALLNNNAGNTYIGHATGLGFPLDQGIEIWIDNAEMINQGLIDQVSGELNLDITKNLYVRMTGNNIASEWYYLNSVTSEILTVTWWKFKVEGIFGVDMSFTSTAGSYATMISGLGLEIKEKITEDRPEFDGRFFAKIHRDLTLDNTIVKYNPNAISWGVRMIMPTTYIGPRYYNGYGSTGSSATGQHQVGTWRADNSTNSHDWADGAVYGSANWDGWGEEPDFAYQSDPSLRESDKYWKNVNGMIGDGSGIFIDNADHNNYDSNGLTLLGAGAGCPSGAHCGGHTWFGHLSPTTVGPVRWCCVVANPQNSISACHSHFWKRTGGPLASARVGTQWGSARYRSNGSTWGISRTSKNITLSVAGTGKDQSKCTNTHTWGGNYGFNNGAGTWTSGPSNANSWPGATLQSPSSVGITTQGAPTSGMPDHTPLVDFMDEIRLPGTLWRWRQDPDQIVYRTIPGNKTDDILMNMIFLHAGRNGACEVGCLCVANWGIWYSGASYLQEHELIAEPMNRLGRRHMMGFKAEVAFGAGAGQNPGTQGVGYLPTNDPRFIQDYPSYIWLGTGTPTGMQPNGAAPTGALANCSYAPGFNPNGYPPGIRSDGMADGQTTPSGTVGSTGQWTGTVMWEILQPISQASGDYGVKHPSHSPAIFETEPKEDVGLNIYHEIGQVYPVAYHSDTNELFSPVGSLVKCWRGSTGSLVPLGGAGTNVPGSGDPWIPPIKVKACNNNTVDLVDAVGNPFVCNTAFPNEHAIQWDSLVFVRPDGSSTESLIIANPNGSSTYTLDRNVWKNIIRLPWFNCYSFGNGVESDRVRDDYNQVTIDNGPKASTTLDDPYQEERRGSGLIYSGIYNSMSGINNLNQFIAAEKITKDLNPTYGSIQKLFSRNTNLVTLCEDKILKVLANKDAMYNADGNINVTSNLNVLGQSVPFVGEYGISKNPESFASESYRAYFSDKQRGVVLRLSQDGVTPISEFGMKDWFADHLLLADRIIGSYDSKKQLYNITLGGSPESPKGPGPGLPGPGRLATNPPLSIGLRPGSNPCNLPCDQNCIPPELPSLPTSWGAAWPGWTHQNGLIDLPGDQYGLPFIMAINCVDETQGGPTDGRWGKCLITQIAHWTDFLRVDKWNTFNSAAPGVLDNNVWNDAHPVADSSGIMLRSNVNHHTQNANPNLAAYVHEYNSSGIMCKVDGLCVDEEYTIEVEYAGGWGTGNLVIGLEDAAGNPEGIIIGSDGVNYNVLYGFRYGFTSFGPNFGSAGVIQSQPFTATQADDNILAIDWHGTGDIGHNHTFPCPTWENYPLIGCTGNLRGFDPPVQPFKITGVKLKCVNPGTVICGCTDPMASNYDPNATIDDGSCIPTQGCLCPDGTMSPLCCPPGVSNAWYQYFNTLSFSENSKGWVSFKSFMKESGLSLNNTYFTWHKGQLWEHHANPIRNNYYGSQFDSSINILFNEAPETVKSFLTVNYEGSQSKITQDITAIATGGLYNDIPHFDDVPKDGWYVEFMETNLQTAGVLEFKNKEGKWFSYPRGEKTEWHNDNPAYWGADRGNIDPREFSYQGISNNCCRTINNNGVEIQAGTCCQLPCTDPTFNIISVIDATMDLNTCTINADGQIQITATSTTIGCGTWDIDLVYTGVGSMPPATVLSFPGNINGSTLTIPNLIPGPYTLNITWCGGGPNCTISTTVTIGSQSVIAGCMDVNALNYDPNAVCDDGSCIYPVPGCMDPNAISCDPSCNGFNPLATIDDGSCCITGCQDPNASNFVPNAHCPVPCTYDPSWNCSGQFGAVNNGVVIAPWTCYDPGNGTGQYQSNQSCVNGCQPNSCIITSAIYNNNGSITFTYNAPLWIPGDFLFYMVTPAGAGNLGPFLLGNVATFQIPLLASSGTITTAPTLAGNGMVDLLVMHIPLAPSLLATVWCTWPDIDTGINPTYTCSGYNGATDSNGTFHVPMTCYDPLDGSGLWPGTVQGLADCSQTGSCLTGACGAATGGCCPHVCCFAGREPLDGLNSNGSITFSWNLDSHSCNHCTQFGGTATFKLTQNTANHVANGPILWTFTTTQCVGTIIIPAFHNGHDFAALHADPANNSAGIPNQGLVINGHSRTTCVDCCGGNMPGNTQPDGSGPGLGGACSWVFNASGV